MFDAGADPSTGYTCMLKTLVAHYREMWSVVPGTTDPMLPFYIVNLHDGAEEGWGGMMAAMTYAHTAGYGSLPNALLPNTHFVQAFDAGDAWDGGEACATSLCCVGTEFPLGPACEGDFRGHWTNDTVDGGGLPPPAHQGRARRPPRAGHLRGAVRQGGLARARHGPRHCRLHRRWRHAHAHLRRGPPQERARHCLKAAARRPPQPHAGEHVRAAAKRASSERASERASARSPLAPGANRARSPSSFPAASQGPLRACERDAARIRRPQSV